MSFSLGIVGLPNVGKSTVFNALARAHAEVSNYPFCTIHPNVGVVEVPDERPRKIAEIMHSAKAIPTTIEFWDIAGLVKGASRGEGLGNQFLSHIRNVEAICHVVRCFGAPQIAHYLGSIDPKRDIEIVNLELILADLQTLEKKLSSVSKTAKAGDKTAQRQVVVLEKIKNALDRGQPARSVHLSEEEKEHTSELHLLTFKPVLYVVNVEEEQIKNPDIPYIKVIKEIAEAEKAAVVLISAKLEEDLEELSIEEAREYLKSAGIPESGLESLIKESYKLLELITFFTANEKEARAWTVRRGSRAQKAAGKVHSDMEKGFIAAEIIHYPDLIKCKSHAEAKEKGLIHLEGKDYSLQDGDLIYFRFHV